MKELTCDRIREIAHQSRGNYEIVLGELQSILAAADGSAFNTVYYAYAYGFLRGQMAEEAKRRKKNIK